jgi:hypothetical protein
VIQRFNDSKIQKFNDLMKQRFKDLKKHFCATFASIAVKITAKGRKISPQRFVYNPAIKIIKYADI